MRIALLTIGDEILAGDILNTNSQYLSEICWQHGFTVETHLSVRDDEPALREALRDLAKSTDVVLCTGGLGPTMDDFTIEVAARTFGVTLVEDVETIRLLESWFTKRGRPLSANNRKQALIPITGKALHNRYGTAPGVYVPYQNCHFYFMPGVPKEMKAIFSESVLPEILARRTQDGDVIFYRQKVLRTFGSPESSLDHALKDLFDSRLSIGNVRVGFRVAFPDVYIKLSTRGAEVLKIESELQDVVEKVKKRIGSFIYSDQIKNLETVVGELLIAKGTRCAVAESCTGGYLAHRITSVAGISSVFAGGVVAYSNNLKQQLLGVSEALLNQFGAVSAECAEAMLDGLCKMSGPQFAAAITGIAGPGGGSADKPVGTVYLAMSCDGVVQTQHHVLPFPREMFKQVVSSIVLRQWLLALQA